jgi:hypothetical protein
MAGAARTRTPSTTNYDVHSATWTDGRPALLPSAMEATDLGHAPSWSRIDPVQVSAFLRCLPTSFITSQAPVTCVFWHCGTNEALIAWWEKPDGRLLFSCSSWVAGLWAFGPWFIIFSFLNWTNRVFLINFLPEDDTKF